MGDYPNVEYVKGNCLKVESFKDVLQDVDACIHTVGALFEKKGHPEKSYQAMNRDTAVNMARELNAHALADAKRRFVMISSAKPPPFLPQYSTTKFEAEAFIVDECPNLDPTLIRPGFIWNAEFRSWSLPLYYGCELMYQLNEAVGKKTPLHSVTDQFFPAKPTKLETVGHFAIGGALGTLEEGDRTNGIVHLERLIKYEEENK